MGTMAYSDISSALNQVYENDIASQINRASVALQVLTVKPANAKNVGWDARFGTSTGAAIADGTNVSTYNFDTKTPATLQFATYHDAFGVTGRAMSAAAASGGPDGLVDLYAESIEESSERLATKLNTEIYSGSGGTSPETVCGLDNSLLASGTYAGLLIATYPQWAATVQGNSSVKRDLSLQLMRDMRKAIYIASGKKPNLILCDPNQHERYGNLLGTTRRYVDEVRIAGRAPIRLDGGYNVLEFDGIPIIEDKDATAGNMYFLNTEEVFLRALPDAVQRMVGGAGEMSVNGTPEEQFGAGMARIKARVQPLAINGDARNYALFTYVQLQVRRPNACGILTDLAS